ncbi:MAG TPA: protein kinase [Terriglobales bacterium]|nr:protein kinase [Terriglobales bacterium]
MIGQRLSHYQIEEQIGAGGMGVVYRAHDEQLDRDVAIKVLPPGSLDEAAHKRFRKEALSLARLNHPNIATVHEFGSQDGVDFLVTEYIAGITLDAKLAAGPVPPAEVIRLGAQMAEGLAAAHKQGIVHRDLKPGNLRLTTDGRLKILDFGLAQIMPHPSEQGLTATITQSQETSGTLPYMSPEQLSGEIADTRSDIWAAGAVLYEMATGKRPFLQPVPALLINAILNQVPEPPSKLNSAVPVALDAVILKALARDRAQRYQSAGELAADLERPAALTSAAVSIVPKQSSGRGLLVVLAVALVSLIAGYFSLRHRSRQSNSAPVVNHRKSVAVLGFKNLSANPEKSWLSTALSEMLTTELSQGDQLRTIPGESVAQMKASLALPDADSFGEQTLTRIRQNLGSDDVVVGSYLPLGHGLLRLDLRLQDAVAGVTLASISEKGSEAEIDELVSKAGTELRAKLGIGALSDAQSAQVRASLPLNPEAARLYSQGLQRLRLFDAQSARNLLEQAAALDPEYAPAHSALAEAWSALGYEAKAKDQARQALALAANFSREDRLLIEGRAHELLAETPQAVESYHALWQLFPDDIDYGLLLIRAQIAAGHASDAERTLSDLRKLPVSEADGARLDATEARVAIMLSDFKRAESSAELAASRGRPIGASLLVAQALQVESQAWERMGQSDKAVEVANQAKELYSSAGNRRSAARCTLTVGDVLYDKGDYAGAKKQFESALAEYRATGAQSGVRAVLERIGNVYYSLGQFSDANHIYRQGLAFDRTINDPGALASDYGNIANALDALGDLSGSLKMQQQALASFNQVGNRRGASDTMNNLANVLVEMGEHDEARKYYEQAIALMEQISFKRGEPAPYGGIGDTYFYQGDFVNGRKGYEHAADLAKELDDEDYGAQVAVALAALDLADKKYSEGEALAAQSAARFEKYNSASNGAWANAILARNLLGEGKLQEAQTAAAKAMKLAQQSPGRAAGFEAAFADMRVKARSGKTAEARKEAEAARDSARKYGYRLYEYQARLALCEIESWSGSASAAADLSLLEKDARAQGALLIANQAHANQVHALQAGAPAKAK